MTEGWNEKSLRMMKWWLFVKSAWSLFIINVYKMKWKNKAYKVKIYIVKTIYKYTFININIYTYIKYNI